MKREFSREPIAMTHRLSGPNGQFQSTADEHYARLLQGAGWKDTPQGWTEVRASETAPETPAKSIPTDWAGTKPAQAADRLPYWALALAVFGVAVVFRLVWLVWTLGGAR